MYRHWDLFAHRGCWYNGPLYFVGAICLLLRCTKSIFNILDHPESDASTPSFHRRPRFDQAKITLQDSLVNGTVLFGVSHISGHDHGRTGLPQLVFAAPERQGPEVVVCGGGHSRDLLLYNAWSEVGGVEGGKQSAGEGGGNGENVLGIGQDFVYKRLAITRIMEQY